MFGWIALVSSGIAMASLSSPSDSRTFFRFGPHDNLIILDFQINTPTRYSLVVVYSFLNAIIRCIYHNLFQPWIINNIQDTSKPNTLYIKRYAYEITLVSSIYNWFDWFLYIAILLAQVDLLIIEVVADLVTNSVTTWMYLRSKKTEDSLLDDRLIVTP